MDKIERALRRKMLSNLARRRKIFPTTGGVRRSRHHLAEFLGEIGYNVGAEIGVRFGRFSKKMCNLNPNLTLYAIDPWIGYNARYTNARQEKIYQEYLKRIEGWDQIKTIRKTSMDALGDFEDGQLDFVYIDGDHTFDFAMMDIICWSKKVKKLGLIMVHDFYPFGDCGVWNAVQAYVHSHNLRCYVTKEHEPTAYWVNP